MAVTFIRVPVTPNEPAIQTGQQYRVIRVTSDIWRRHNADCKEKELGRRGLRCDCPLWGDGYIDSTRVLRQSLDTRSLDDAQRRLDDLVTDRTLEMFPTPAIEEEVTRHTTNREREAEPGQSEGTPVLDSTPENDPRLFRNVAKAYLKHCETNGVKVPTLGKYRNVTNHLAAYAESAKVNKPSIEQFEITDLDSYRASRTLAKTTSVKELETLRQLWDFATARGWCKANIARQVKAPRITEQNSVVPYTKRELKAMFDATDTFGQHSYERKRARGLLSVLRFTSLRISDIALLRKDRISRHRGVYEVFLHTTKNNAAVLLPVPKEMMDALNALPLPRGASDDCPYYFWNGKSKPKSMISVAEETLAAVFRESGVEGAGAHRFRHTIATELLGAGATFEEVADILANSPAIVRKHYGKWSNKRQGRVNRLMRLVHGKSWKVSA